MTWRYTGQKKEVNISVGDEEIDSVHRAGRGNSKNNEPRPILIEFSWPPGKVKVVKNTRTLKEKGASVRELLTKTQGIDSIATGMNDSKNMWTVDGKTLISGAINND